MIIDKFKIYDWKITIFYDTICDDLPIIVEELISINCPDKYIDKALDNLEACELNSGITYSNMSRKSSILVIGRVSSFEQIINTIAHEYYHLICHISKGLKINDEEFLANLNGNLNMRSFLIVRELF